MFTKNISKITWCKKHVAVASLSIVPLLDAYFASTGTTSTGSCYYFYSSNNMVTRQLQVLLRVLEYQSGKKRRQHWQVITCR
jgi:hypothetical protein